MTQKKLVSGAHAPGTTHVARPYGSLVVHRAPFRRIADEGNATIHTGRPALLRPQPGVAPEKVLQAFNTWAFKREQPDSAQGLLKVIAEATRLGKPVPFVLYWGKGPRSQIAAPETVCLDYLASMRSRVQQAYPPGASFKLICTDTHANLNGHEPEAIAAYFEAVEAAARARGFESCWLSELVFAAEAADAIDLADEPVAEEVLKRLGACAAKWFRGEGTPAEGAARYLQMNMVEKRAVQFAFPQAIFVTFNGSEYRCLFPARMPIFYMYSLRRGTAVKPWFMPAPDVAAAQPAADTAARPPDPPAFAS